MFALSYKKLTIILTSVSILLVLWLSAAFTLIIVKGDSIYQPDKSQTKDYNVSIQTEMVANKFGEKIEILTAQSQIASSEVFLYLHGNVGRSPRLIEEMSQFGLVVSPTYPGFGNSEGKPNTERIYNTVDTVMFWLVEKGINPSQVTVIGHSMGGAAAAYAGAEYPDLKKVILVNTFYSIQAMCEKDYYILCALSGGVLNTATIAPKIMVKTRVFNSINDKTVPYQQGKDLFNLIGSKDKKFTDLKDVNTDDYHSGFSVAEILVE